ncbi:uncharacterized protein LOC116340690 [Contarinia nasturtii]|uniref:uncharacterized protein LOC116340690 n=1 Tax=Contarinia nasturtii TaxID=265458 RepID=UPI0012D4AB09|nr:uncharacterized protein LOC116340690 [Contarinia nasturtii]
MEKVISKLPSDRMLYVWPIESSMLHRIKPYLDQFGEIESMRLHVEDNFKYGYCLQFKTAKSVSAVLSKSSHVKIDNRNFKVRAGGSGNKPSLVPESLFEEPPDEGSSSNILAALNDDCLSAVFQHLELMDLTSAAQVCVHFQKLAQETFKIKFKILQLELKSKSISKITMKREEVEMILRNFSPVIQSLKVDSINFNIDDDSSFFMLPINSPYLRLISKYGLTQLRELELSNFKVKENPESEELRPLFSQLEKLHLHNCKFDESMRESFSACKKLKTFHFVGCEISSGIFIEQNFPKLEEARFINCSGLYESNLRNFMKLNPTLIKFSVTLNYHYSGLKDMDIIQLIYETLPHLTELEIDLRHYGCDLNRNIIYFGQMSALTVLKLGCGAEPVAKLLECLASNKAPIEHLNLRSADINDEIIAQVAKMKQIKILDLVNIYGELCDEHLIEIAKGLPQLEQLDLRDDKLFKYGNSYKVTISGLKAMLLYANNLSLINIESIESIKINVEAYQSMLTTIQNRSKEVKVLIKIKSYGKKSYVPESILAANREILYIDETIEEKPFQCTCGRSCFDSSNCICPGRDETYFRFLSDLDIVTSDERDLFQLDSKSISKYRCKNKNPF